MKKFALGLLAVGAVCALGFAACKQNETSESTAGLPVEKEEAVRVKISYDEKTGEISWEPIALAKEYKITVTYYLGEETSVTTEETSYVWPLKSGVSLLKVVALDENGKELAVGVKTTQLEVDIGAPDKPTGLAYTATTGVLSWDETENAESYYIQAKSITNSAFVLEETLTTSTASNIKLDLPAGIYKLSVSAVSDSGARGYAETIEWASYDIPDFNTDSDGDGIYHLLDFEDERVLELVRDANYREWATGVIDKVEYGVETKDGGTNSKMLAIKQKNVKNADGADVNYFGGITLRFPEQIEFGSIRFDAYRNNYVGFGIMFEDDNGVQVNSSIAWDETESYNRLHTYTVTMDSLLEKEEAFAGVREITFYSRNGKWCDFYFDNLCYDPVGEIGDIAISEDRKTISWDEVIGADGYILKVNGEEKYNGEDTQVTLPSAYDSECAYVELAVMKGENVVRTAEKLLVCYCNVCDGFGEAVGGVENAYYLADFTKHGYENNIVAEAGGSHAFVNANHLEYTSMDDWSNVVSYTLPSAIQSTAKLANVYFTIKRVVGSFPVWIYETSGRYIKANLGEWNQADIDAAGDEWTTLKVSSYTVYDANGTELVGETWDGTIAKLVFRNGNIPNGVAPTYKVKNVYYTTYPENFDELKAGTTNEYYVADFTKNSYAYCMQANNGTYEFVENSHLQYSSTDDWSGIVTYELPYAITGAASLKFTMKAVQGNIIVRVYQTNGNYMYINFRNGYAQASTDWICEDTSDINIAHEVRDANGTKIDGVKWDGTVTKIVFWQSGVTTPTYQIQSITYTKAVTE